MGAAILWLIAAGVFWFFMPMLFKKRNPDKEALYAECKEAVLFVRDAAPSVRIAIGYGINLARDVFLAKYQNIEHFKQAPESEKNDVLKKYTAVVGKLIQQDGHTALGFRMFSMWLCGFVEDDRFLKKEMGKIVIKLSQEGDIRTLAGFTIDSGELFFRGKKV